jgi:3-oxoacyl-[acyl-carrier protein] reductase
MNRFADKRVVVTGAASGIGLATATAFVHEGARVVLLDRNREAVEEAAAHLGEAAQAFALDVSDAAAVEHLFNGLLEALGGLNVLVNNAGVGAPATLEGMTPDMWRKTLSVNLDGAFFCTRAAVPLMKACGSGAVINIASVAGKRLSHHGGADYTSSKSGLLGLTRHAAFELARYRVRVNAICPGLVLTPMVQAVSSPDQLESSKARIPLGRWVMPQDVAASVLFLSSDDASMITGSTIDVDGGLMVSNGQAYSEYLARRGEG